MFVKCVKTRLHPNVDFNTSVFAA